MSGKNAQMWSDLRMGTTTVLVADAQRLFSGALALALGLKPDLAVLDERPISGPAAVEAVRVWTPDVVLMDNWIDGAEAVKQIVATAPASKVLLLSWIKAPDQVREAIDAGAVGFLPKSLTIDRVAEAIRLAHAGQTLVYADELKRLMENINERDKEADEFSARIETLSARELQILLLLSQGKLIQEVAKELDVVPGTVTAHINQILKKTGARSQAEALAMARQWGSIPT